MIKDWMVLPFSSVQRREFRRGGWRAWAQRYPMLFDEQDCDNAKGQAFLGYHFFEWLAAISIYEQTGHRSLMKKYNFKGHEQKRERFCGLVPECVLQVFDRPQRFGRAQGPDLFVYRDAKDWFFCEVKGPRDRLRPAQQAFFHAIEQACDRAVRLVRFFRLPDSKQYSKQ